MSVNFVYDSLDHFVNLDYNTSVSLIPAFGSGVHLIGWYTDALLTALYTGTFENITSNLVVYASKVSLVKISFDWGSDYSGSWDMANIYIHYGYNTSLYADIYLVLESGYKYSAYIPYNHNVFGLEVNIDNQIGLGDNMKLSNWVSCSPTYGDTVVLYHYISGYWVNSKWQVTLDPSNNKTLSFSTEDYSSWGDKPWNLRLVLTFVGGATATVSLYNDGLTSIVNFNIVLVSELNITSVRLWVSQTSNHFYQNVILWNNIASLGTLVWSSWTME
jgi:hypothetical protein